jgi:hypothetical protein
MTTTELLALMRLLSALESWSFSCGTRLPDHLCEAIGQHVERIEAEILQGMK